MITAMENISITDTSHPFLAVSEMCELEKHGYVEEEYFMSGTANIYKETDEWHHVKPIYENAPYTTRLLVRKPKDITKFSGNVVVEILNASAFMDIDRMWVNLWQYIVSNGDIYIGITSKGHVVDCLKRFDPVRYQPINWSNPMPERNAEGREKDPFGFLPQYESGLFWDMQVELAKLLRTDNSLNPIREYGKNYLYLTGWSQSGFYMSRLLHSFVYQTENSETEPLFDGYLEAGSDCNLAPINSYEPSVNDWNMGQSGAVGRAGFLIAREPYIVINTESENRGANWMGDSDLPDARFRTYQIPGTSHDAKYNMLDYYQGHLREECRKYHFELEFGGKEGEPLDTPYHYIFMAALRNLYCWVREGVPAPHAPKIDMVMDPKADPMNWTGEETKQQERQGETLGIRPRFQNKKDAFGNTTGGIRLAAVDYPVGIYQSYSRKEDGSIDAAFGTVFPFSKEMLTSLYGTLEHYRSLVRRQAKETVALGFLRKEDLEAYVEDTVALAAKRGLK